MAKSKKKQVAKEINDLEEIKSDFITVASHQLRTPISAIRWSLDTLLSGRAGRLLKKQKEVASEAYQNNNFMVKVVNDLLRVSRLEEKGINLTPKPTNLAKLIREAIKKQEDFCTACNCKFVLNIEKSLPKAYVDPLQIKLVVDALIDNAIRYGKSKGVVKITLKKLKEHLLLKIQDKGIGISTDQQKLVFSKFFRGRNAMKAQTEGLGLNLYLAKKIVEASGGKIDFNSKENKETTFNIYLPLSAKDSSGVINLKSKREEPNDILKKEREFVSITVHELKAPLGTTKWSLEILKNEKSGKLNKNQSELIDQIYRGNERLLVLVRDLLNLSKLQEGKFEIETKTIQFYKVINDVVDGFRLEAQKKKIKFQWSPPTKVLPKVKADPNRIAQVATNLVSNAVKYTPNSGQIVVKIEKKTGAQLKKISNQLTTANIVHSDNKKGYLVFSVKDTGIGISEVDQNKLFSKFFRSSKVLKSKAEGTGLGLYITKSIVELHRGDIWFISKPGKGSTFYFSLPIA